MLLSFVFIVFFFFLNNESSATALGHYKVVQIFPLHLILYEDIFTQLINPAC